MQARFRATLNSGDFINASKQQYSEAIIALIYRQVPS
ncbi:hypothetical protein GNIT_3618 [Glaciecola nitratireducens FR1064]|uniref:Uncharacterized protein n=1 Tax=Glaciecola nitratireducens (strain JCM 12485 / KCTC 12276 / FR1064) TaxID=1085623 RepID=G4QP05_GLANF|nr:hypothetical protein GNIT_3618 [Glaciecola nitratireducens FR1064]